MQTGIDFSAAPIPPCDQKVTQIEARRLSRQSLEILDRLRAGPATNVALAAIALKYTSRISDIRAAGYDVRVIERSHETGVTVYRLVAEKPSH